MKIKPFVNVGILSFKSVDIIERNWNVWLQNFLVKKLKKGYLRFHRLSLSKRSCYFEKWIEYVINFRLRTKTEENFILWKFNFLWRHIFRKYFIISSTKRAGNFMIILLSIIVIEQFRLRLHIIIKSFWDLPMSQTNRSM